MLLHSKKLIIDNRNISYITEGLVLWLDGIWNNGINNHSCNLSQWKNLVQNDITVDIPYNIVIGDQYLQRDSGDVITINDPSSLLNIYDDLTVELTFMNTGSTSNQRIFGRNHPNSYYFNTANNRPGMWYCNKDYATLLWTSGQANLNTICQQKVVINYSSNTIYGYIENVLKGSTSIVNSASSYYGQTTIFNSGDTTQNPFIGKIFTIRVYNRALTEIEIDNNYNLDLQRFNFT